MDNNNAFNLWQFDVLASLNYKTQLVKNRLTNQLMIKKIMPISEYNLHKKLCEIDCKNIVKIYDVVTDNNVCIVLEQYIEGMTIEQLCANQLVSESRTAEIMVQICNGLEVLHNDNIVHRDITPTNIIISSDNIVKIIDFDISRFQKQNVGHDTTILGTEGYAAPEQFGFKQSDERTDIYAMGVLMNFMLTGCLPSKVTYSKGRMADIIKKCIEFNAENRYRNVNELRRALNNSRGKGLYFAESFFKNIPGYRSDSVRAKVFATLGYIWIIFSTKISYDTFCMYFYEYFYVTLGALMIYVVPILCFSDFMEFQECIPIIRRMHKPTRRVIFGIIAVISIFSGARWFVGLF